MAEQPTARLNISPSNNVFQYALQGKEVVTINAEDLYQFHTAWSSYYGEAPSVPAHLAKRILEASGLAQGLLAQLWDVASQASFLGSETKVTHRKGYLSRQEFYSIMDQIHQEYGLEPADVSNAMVSKLLGHQENTVALDNPFASPSLPPPLAKESTKPSPPLKPQAQSSAYSTEPPLEISERKCTNAVSDQAAKASRQLPPHQTSEFSDGLNEYASFLASIDLSGNSKRIIPQSQPSIATSSVVHNSDLPGSSQSLPYNFEGLQLAVRKHEHTEQNARSSESALPEVFTPPSEGIEVNERVELSNSAPEPYCQRSNSTQSTGALELYPPCETGVNTELDRRLDIVTSTQRPENYNRDRLLSQAPEVVDRTSSRKEIQLWMDELINKTRTTRQRQQPGVAPPEDIHEVASSDVPDQKGQEEIVRRFMLRTPEPINEPLSHLGSLLRKSKARLKAAGAERARKSLMNSSNKLTDLLEEAAEEGNLDLVKAVLGLGANVRWRDEVKGIPHHALEKAAAANRVSVVEHFMNHGPTQPAQSKALLIALENHNLQLALSLLFAYDVQVDCCNLSYDSKTGEAQSIIRNIMNLDSAHDSTGEILLTKLLELRKLDPGQIVHQVRFTIKGVTYIDSLTALSFCVREGLDNLVKNMLTAMEHGSPFLSSRQTLETDTIGAPITYLERTAWENSPKSAHRILVMLLDKGSPINVKCHRHDTVHAPFSAAIRGGSLEGTLTLLKACPELLRSTHIIPGSNTHVFSCVGLALFCCQWKIASALSTMESFSFRIPALEVFDSTGTKRTNYITLAMTSAGTKMEPPASIIKHLLQMRPDMVTMGEALGEAFKRCQPRTSKLLLEHYKARIEKGEDAQHNLLLLLLASRCPIEEDYEPSTSFVNIQQKYLQMIDPVIEFCQAHQKPTPPLKLLHAAACHENPTVLRRLLDVGLVGGDNVREPLVPYTWQTVAGFHRFRQKHPQGDIDNTWPRRALLLHKLLLKYDAAER